MLDSKQISPGQTYVARDGNTAPLGYVFHGIEYNLYNLTGQVVYGSAPLTHLGHVQNTSREWMATQASGWITLSHGQMAPMKSPLSDPFKPNPRRALAAALNVESL